MTKNADGSMTFNGTTTTSAVYFNLNQSESGYVYLESGKTYTLSTSTPMPSNTRLCCRNATGSTTNYIDIYGGNQTSKTATMSVSDNTFTYFAVYNTGTVVNNLTIYPMLEQSAAATAYEPFVGGIPAPNPDYPQAVQTVTGENVVKISDGQGNEQSYTVDLGSIELCKIGDYQDSIYKSDGKWYVRKEVGKAVYSSSDFTLANNDNYTNVRYAQFAKPEDNIQYGNYDYGSITNYFTAARNMGGMPSGGWDSFNAEGEVYNNATRTAWWCSFPKTTSLDTIKSKLNGMTAYYALATPTDTEIANAALIAQLEAILSQGYTYAGTNNITTVISAGNEQGELEIEYYTRYDLTITAGGYEWEQGGSGGPTTVMNESIDNVYPIWTITGPITNPVLENTTTGEQIEYVGTIGEGQTLVIDMGAQTALLDGLNVVANIVGEFLSLAPGSNTLIYSVDSGDKASEIGWSEIVG